MASNESAADRTKVAEADVGASGSESSPSRSAGMFAGSSTMIMGCTFGEVLSPFCGEADGVDIVIDSTTSALLSDVRFLRSFVSDSMAACNGRWEGSCYRLKVQIRE